MEIAFISILGFVQQFGAQELFRIFSISSMSKYALD